MTTTHSRTPPSPTGRLTTSEPDMQYFPGTPQAIAQLRRMKEAASRNDPFRSFFDFSNIENRLKQQDESGHA